MLVDWVELLLLLLLQVRLLLGQRGVHVKLVLQWCRSLARRNWDGRCVTNRNRRHTRSRSRRDRGLLLLLDRVRGWR